MTFKRRLSISGNPELPDIRGRVLRFVDRALATDHRIDRLFWLLTVAEEINGHAKDAPAALLDAAARRIHTTHRVSYRERQQAMLTLVAQVVPLS